jgi:hypothetical protein
MRSFVKTWATMSLGALVCVSACAKPIVATEPALCPPFTLAVLDEYEKADGLPLLQLWVRGAERACRANEELTK